MAIHKNTTINLSLYALALVGTIVGSVGGQHYLVLICKPMLTIVLSSWFFFKSRRVGDRFTLLIQAGLFFSLIGDLALIHQHSDQFYFMLGLGAFLLAQTCYALAFMHNVVDASAGRQVLVPLLMTGVLLAYALLFISELLPHLDDTIMPPVVVYAAAITFMGIMAAFRYGRTYPRSFVLVLVGALLFIASDTLLAVDRFIKPLPHASWSVLLTYGVAQVLIVAGSLIHVLNPEEIRRRAALTT